MAFDPLKPPMSAAQSEELIKRAGDWEATKAGWTGMLGELQMLVVVVGGFAAVVLTLWIAGAAFGTTAPGLLGLLVAVLWLGRRS